MDHWGDPWSDNVNDASTTKTEVTSPLPPAQTSAPVLLNGFLDDAGWGNDDASFGDWTTAPQPSVPIATTTPHAPTDDADVSLNHGIDQRGALWGDEEHGEPVPLTENREGAQHLHLNDEVVTDGVPSEVSGSATTVQQDQTPDDATAIESSGHLQPYDDSAARPSTSLSERSHNEPPVDSPRTSVVEDRKAIKSLDSGTVVLDGPAAGDQRGGYEGSELLEENIHEANGALTKDDSNGMLPKDDEPGFTKEQSDSGEPISSDQKDEPPGVQRLANKETTLDQMLTQNAPCFDAALLDDLFPPLEESGKRDEATEDPIYSTSGRKAWYRLTRRQTLREFNNGNADDNYIRVTWVNSEIRKEMNKIVGRWAREDRLSGTGPGARASFYWDSAAPLEPKIPLGHSRTKTSVPTPRAANPARHSLPPVTTSVPAAFNWSSAAGVDPWKLDSPGLRSTSSPLTARPIMSDNLAQTGSRAVSTRLASPDLGTRDQVSNTVPETSGVTSPIAPLPITPALPTFPEQWNNSNSIDTIVVAKAEIEDPDVDDDDEWGEMVGSPTFAEPQTPKRISQTTLLDDLDLTRPATPAPSRSLSSQKQSADAMHASHITRLKGTISPTSAIFGTRSFVPLGVEQGPIGPALLKPVRRPEPLSFNAASDKVPSAVPPEVSIVQNSHNEYAGQVFGPHEEIVIDVPHLEPAFVPVGEDEFSAFASSAPAPPSSGPDTSHVSAATEQPVADAWADADFSFFESAPPVPVPAPSKTSGPEAFPVFATPTRSARSSSAASSKGFARSPPRTSPPAIQPLTEATNAAQRRKDEEEKTIRDILGGLPNLGYMLR